MIHAQPNLYSPFRLSEIGSTFKVCLLLGLVAFSSAWADESGRWIPVKSQSKEKFYYDSFNISKNGQVSNIQFQNPLLSDAILVPAYSAIMNSAPFPKLPTGYPSNSVKVDFTFNYQIYGH